MFSDITVEEMLEKFRAKELTIIDVRSPREFANATIPGSLNIPLFDDAERAEVGTLYAQISPDAAKARGLEIVSAKLPRFIQQFAEIPGPKAVFCWRGGMRSKTAATLLDLMGMPVRRLSGGYRAYRKWVLQTLDNYRLTQTCIVINGYTGTGKTWLLRQLAAKGYPVVDLEAMAGHRGSIFGGIGLKPANQKTLDSLLLHRLEELKGSPYFLMEAESARIGNCVAPQFLMDAKENGIHVFIEVPEAERIKQILHDYDPHQFADACADAFARIKERIHTPIAAQIAADLREKRFARVVANLLRYYYDPRYEYAIEHHRPDSLHLRGETCEEVLAKLENWLEKFSAMSVTDEPSRL
ncbi:MAG TPA: tRNA 2-selenouridine(34) synthase MnmH [Bacilli bacterium]